MNMREITPTEGQRIDDRPMYMGLHRGVWPLYPDKPLPAGCDQQGRYATRVDTAGMSPAECCTEMGAEDEPARMGDGAGVFIWPAVTALALFALLAVVHFWRAA